MKHTITALTFFALMCGIFFVVLGCSKYEGNTYWDLLDKRFRAQEVVLGAMRTHRETSLEVQKGKAQLKEYLKDRKGFETIESFEKGEVDPELDIAYSLWLTLRPDMVLLEQIETRLNEIRASRLLEDLEVAIKTMENNEKLGTLGIIDRKKIDESFAKLIKRRSIDDILDSSEFEEKAVKNFVDNW